MANTAAHMARIARLGGIAQGRQAKARARHRWSLLVASCADKWAVWPVAYRAGFRAASSAAERRGFAKGYEQALRDRGRAS